MTESTRSDHSALARLTAINPVPQSEHGKLVARLSDIRPQLPELDRPSARRRLKTPMIAFGVVLLLGVGGVAVASSWNPLSTIGSANRPPEPTDTLSPVTKEMLEKTQLGGGTEDVIGRRLVDDARLLGELPNRDKVYAVPTSKGKLCIVVAESTASCSDPLTRERPITFTTMKVGPLTPLVIWGATTNDVVSVSFKVGGHPVTVPVVNNFFAWEGPPSTRFGSVSPAIVTFTDGTVAPAQ